MTRKQNTLYGAIGLILGIMGGVAGTAFSIGADKQRINDILTRHSTEMIAMKVKDESHERATQRELDRFSEIIAGQMTQLQSSIAQLTLTVGNLRTDVGILKALMERMEIEIKARVNSD